MIQASSSFVGKLAQLRRTPIYKIAFDNWDDTFSTQKIKSFLVAIDEATSVDEFETISETKQYEVGPNFLLPDESPIGDLFFGAESTSLGPSKPYLGIPSGVQGQVYPEQGHASIGVVGVVITDKLGSITELVSSGVIARRVQVFEGFEGIDEDDFAVVFTGLVSAVRMTSDFAGYEFQFYSPQTLVNKQIFDLASTVLAADMGAEDLTFTVATPETFTDTNSGTSETYVLIDNERIYCTPAADFETSGIMEVLSRGVNPVEHQAQTQVRQMLRIGPGHPVDILILICLETAARWGLSIDPIYMDFAGLAIARDILGPTITMDFQLIDAENAMEFFEQEIYRVCGAYPFVTADGKISMKVVAAPEEGDVIETIDHDSIVTDDDGTPMMEWSQGWDGSLGEVINHVTFKFDFNPQTGDYESIAEFSRPFSIQTFGDHPITLESKGLRLEQVDTLEFIAARATAILDRSENGIPLIKVRTFLQKELIEPGDIVSFSSSLLPDRFSKARGIVGGLMEVVNRSVHFETGQVEMQLLWTSFSSLAHDEFDRADVFWGAGALDLGSDGAWTAMAQDTQGIRIDDQQLFLGRAGTKLFPAAGGNGVLVRTQIYGPNQQSELTYRSTTGAGAWSGPALDISFTSTIDPYLVDLSCYAAIYDSVAGKIRLQLYFGTDPTISTGATLASYDVVLVDGDRVRIQKRPGNLLSIYLNDAVIINSIHDATLNLGLPGAVTNWQGTAGGSWWDDWRGGDSGFA